MHIFRFKFENTKLLKTHNFQFLWNWKFDGYYSVWQQRQNIEKMVSRYSNLKNVNDDLQKLVKFNLIFVRYTSFLPFDYV